MLSDGQLGVYAWRSAEVVGHAWAVLCRAGRMRANGYFALTEREALIHYCFVSPVHRGVAIYPLMLQTLSRLLFASHGIHRVLVDSECTNLPSLRGIAKAGFQPVATGTYVMFGGRLLLERVRPWGGDVG
jgi:RimJ/RimL family protein N-acetyltransferase